MFEGPMVAIVTPFKEGQVDETALRQLIDRQIANGTSVIVPCGTTGESATLTHEEHACVIGIAVDQVAGRAKVLAGAGSNATHEALRLHHEAERLGADGALHITPYYNKPNQEGLYQHFRTIAERSRIPIILYNVPGRTSVNLLPETVARLSQIDTIVGIKEASGKLEQIQKILDSCPPEFCVLSGEDAQTLDMYRIGARGAISVTANVVPGDCSREWALFKAGDVSAAEALHTRLMPLHDLMFIDTNPIPVKAALAMLGLIHDEIRLPLVTLDAVRRGGLRTGLEQYGLIGDH